MSFVDPNIARKDALQTAHLERSPRLPDGSPVFSHIEMSILGLCNRSCHFCPRVDPKVYPNVNEFMSLDLHKKILGDLKEISYEGGLSYSGFSEPLLHKGVVDFVHASREILPGSRLEIVTNGDVLEPGILKKLIDAGLSTLLVSMYDGPEQIPHFEKIIQEADVDSKRVILRKRYLPPTEDYGITLSNRSGMVTIKEAGIVPLKEPMRHPCYYTHYRMMVDHTGEVLLCPHDWGKRLIAGDLNKEHIVDIWTGPKLAGVRKRLAVGDRRIPPCSNCDVLGTRQGGAHFKAWTVFYEEKEKISAS